MSASDKKKLRKEQASAILSEKQIHAQKEAKKLKIYTLAFVIVMIAIVVITAAALIVRAVDNSGILLKNTIAASVDDYELNTIELNYYYNDAINEFYNELYSQYNEYTDSYLEAIGLDATKALDKQFYDEENKQTWADYFVNAALDTAKSDYTFYEKAMADDFKLSADDQTALDDNITNLETYATLYGYSNADQYIRAMYGGGADMKSYKAYMERRAVADGYVHEHEHSLKYEDADIREFEKDKISNYNSYTYHSSYLSYTDFREGGVEDEEGNKTYTAEQDEAGRAAMKTAAEQLASCKTLEELTEMLPTITVNEDSQLVINEYKNELHTTISSADLANWFAAEDRKEGDIAAIANTYTNTDENGNETSVINGYYVVYFVSKNDNAEPMSSVRHLLVQFEGGEQDEATGETIYTVEEMNAAKEEAEGYLKTWQEGAATEESFIELVKEYSDDTSAETGGLFENITPNSEYVENFLHWSISPDRKAGDAEVIETEYGYHVMYYVGDTELTYRDYMISNEMAAKEQQEWYDGILETVTAKLLDTSKMPLSRTLTTG